MDTFSNAVILITIIAGLAIPLGLVLLIIGSMIDKDAVRKFSVRLLLVAGIVLLVSFSLCSLGVVKLML